MTLLKLKFLTAIFACISICCFGQHPSQVLGWNILSDSYPDAIATIRAAKLYNINHLQLSHDIVMNLREVEKCPINYSAPEYQVFDNENHGDARKDIAGNRKSASLYNMISANPQNAKPYGKWNKARITVYNGTVIHYQNGQAVLKYQLWTPEWKALLHKGKFAEKKNPTAFGMLSKWVGIIKKDI